MRNYEYYKNNKKLLEICTGVNFNYILESFKSWCNSLSLGEKQEIVLKELDRFDNMNLNNDYYVSDRHKLIKELENDLNVEINSLNRQVSERRKNMKIFTRSEILKENNKYFIQVTITDNENNTIENHIIYGKTKEEIINIYNKMKERSEKNGANK